VRNRHETFVKRYDEAFKEVFPEGTGQTVDLVGVSLALFRRLSPPADSEVAIRALHLLNSWMQIEKIQPRLSKKNTEGKKSLDLVKGINELVTEIRAMKARGDASSTPPNQTRTLVLTMQPTKTSNRCSKC